MNSGRFRINNPPVVAETLDGEATIVDLESGTYYSLNESGSFVWEELARGAATPEIVVGLSSRYEIESKEATEAVETLVAELVEKKLIAPRPADAGGASPVGNGSAPAPAPISAYAPPVLKAFTDMQELLLLDPVHEVDDAGWPNPH